MTEKETIDQIISRREISLETEESDRALLVEYVREFVDAKRGNQKLLAEASSIPQNKISSLIRNSPMAPGMGVIVTLAKTIKNIL
ncbi:XRE family transcriptional regulator [Leptospira santarosai]|uniref:XRE family transcriptional regulator n=1 Tax=Leptospira santarosai TaxID=28183 RepID=UPI0024AF4DD1|nr:XRE family transcriptional regulator [Leptospira santarosai]MDI7219377.1 XRE family transcriptional regulator [Leptospira santarosai]